MSINPMKYKFVLIDKLGVSILLILVSLEEYLILIRGWSYKVVLSKKHGSHLVYIGHQNEKGYHFQSSSIHSLLSNVDLDKLPWEESNISIIAN